MGMDMVELIMDIEDRFNIAIPDEDFERVRTVGAFHEHVLAQLAIKRETEPVDHPRSRPHCPTQQAFLTLRQAIQTTRPDAANARIRPSTLLADLFPRNRRRSAWKNLGKQLDVWLPMLKLPRPIGTLIKWLVPIGLTGLAIAAATTSDFPGEAVFQVFYGSIMTAIALAAGFVLSRPFATQFRPELATVGDVARHLFEKHPYRYDGTRDAAPTMSDEEVWDIIVDRIAEIGGIERDTIRSETRFIEDIYFG